MMDYDKVYALVNSTIQCFKIDKAEFNQAFNTIEQLKGGEYLVKVCGVIIWFDKEYNVTRYCFNWRPPSLCDEEKDYRALMNKIREKGLI